METLEELKAIVENAPEGATHIDEDGDYVKPIGDELYYYSFVNGVGWSTEYFIPCRMRSLSDIKRIIELMELLEGVESLGFLEPSHDSGKSHRDLCDRYKELKL